MPALICGSLAFDTITTFEGRFADHILPQQIHILNVSFLVPAMRREYGGCAGNIAYSLHLLGGTPHILAMLGRDGHSYLARLESLGIGREGIGVADDSYTAQAMITTDRDNNQITAFHPGAMQLAHELHVPEDADIKVGIVAPDGRDAMVLHAREMAAAGIPFVFDPGQGLPMFDGEELMQFVGQATWVALNDYEAQLMVERTGRSIEELSRSHLRGIIVTLGAQGCEVWQDGQRTAVPGVAAERVVDPTGCGDAFRAALLYGLERDWDLVRCAALGNQVGAIKIAQPGPQNHTLDRAALGLD